ncbi:HIT domain-containing protein [Dokdonella sp.]|uniref:HIT domain-containing protein n=1 Tax=Dokdonella sp. TaxID=2291710 RepID=UPI003784F070
MSFQLDPRLAGDTHLIGELGLSRLLLMDDARYPWLILVPRIAGARELFDLDGSDRATLLAELDTVGRALETLLRPDKFNIAALGNVVPQLHVHVVARYSADAAWPRPVWGIGERVPYEGGALARRVAELREALATVLG